MDVLTVCRQNIWKDLFDIICSWTPLTTHLIKVRQNWFSWKNIWNGCKEGEWNSFYYDDCLYTISSKLYLIFNEVKISAQNIKIFLSALKAYYVTVDPLREILKDNKLKNFPCWCYSIFCRNSQYIFTMS